MDTIRIRIPLNSSKPLTEDIAVSQLNRALNILVSEGALVGAINDILVDYDIQLSSNYVVAEVTKDSYRDAAHFQTVGAEKVFSNYEVSDGHDLEDELDRRGVTPEEVFGEEKSFSAAAINERLKLAKLDPRVQLRYIVLDYKRYYNQKKNSLDLINAQNLRNSFVNEVMALFTKILPLIKEGKQLNSLLGVSQVTPELTKISRDLSLSYKKALISESSQGAPTKNLYQKLVVDYKLFIDGLINSVMPGIMEIINPTPSKSTPTESVTPTKKFSLDGRYKLFNE